MDKLFLLSVIVLSFFSCNQQTQEIKKKNKAESELSDAISKAEKSEVLEKNTFLGFEFGMTEKEVDNYFSKLIKEGVIYVNSKDKFQYDFSFRGGDIYLNFVPEYYDGKLYKMIYPANTPSGFSGHVFLMTAFTKTRDEFEAHRNNDIMGDTYYTNIKDNLIITFKDSRMIYENAPISKLVKHKAEEIKKEKSNKSNSEF